jgi:hypothetical protein
MNTLSINVLSESRIDTEICTTISTAALTGSQITPYSLSGALLSSKAHGAHRALVKVVHYLGNMVPFGMHIYIYTLKSDLFDFRLFCFAQIADRDRYQTETYSRKRQIAERDRQRQVADRDR